jgi:hypothetical protein
MYFSETFFDPVAIFLKHGDLILFCFVMPGFSKPMIFSREIVHGIIRLCLCHVGHVFCSEPSSAAVNQLTGRLVQPADHQ